MAQETLLRHTHVSCSTLLLTNWRYTMKRQFPMVDKMLRFPVPAATKSIGTPQEWLRYQLERRAEYERRMQRGARGINVSKAEFERVLRKALDEHYGGAA